MNLYVSILLAYAIFICSVITQSYISSAKDYVPTSESLYLSGK